jgi:hypothetical protein
MTRRLTDSEALKTEAARETAAERMRRCRARRRAGYRCLTIELHRDEIDAFVQRGLLRIDDVEDPDAIATALYGYLEASIGPPS